MRYTKEENPQKKTCVCVCVRMRMLLYAYVSMCVCVSVCVFQMRVRLRVSKCVRVCEEEKERTSGEERLPRVQACPDKRQEIRKTPSKGISQEKAVRNPENL
ncbi:MAG: hypothetical protein GY820_28180 [Gammaproteobacteria bacterium]|nr:hypothetical protein [Gammaproteobacteria bacterium]